MIKVAEFAACPKKVARQVLYALLRAGYIGFQVWCCYEVPSFAFVV